MTHPFILASFKVETAGIWITVICDNCGPNTLFSVSAALVGKINYQCWMLSETFVWRHLLSTEYKCAGLEPSCRLHLTGTLGHQNRSASCQNKSPSPSPAHSSGGCSRALQHCSVNAGRICRVAAGSQHWSDHSRSLLGA